MTEALPRALLVAVKLPGIEAREFDSSLEELGRLVTTLGYAVVGQITQQRSALVAASVIGEGKLQELSERTGGSGETAATLPRVKDKARVRRELEAE